MWGIASGIKKKKNSKDKGKTLSETQIKNPRTAILKLCVEGSQGAGLNSQKHHEIFFSF